MKTSRSLAPFSLTVLLALGAGAVAQTLPEFPAEGGGSGLPPMAAPSAQPFPPEIVPGASVGAPSGVPQGAMSSAGAMPADLSPPGFGPVSAPPPPPTAAGRTLDGVGNRIDDVVGDALKGVEDTVGVTTDLGIAEVQEDDAALLEAIRQTRRATQYLQAQNELAAQAVSLLDKVVEEEEKPAEKADDTSPEKELERLQAMLAAAKIRAEIYKTKEMTAPVVDPVVAALPPQVPGVVVEVLGRDALVLFSDPSLGERMVREGERLPNGTTIVQVVANGVVIRTPDGAHQSLGLGTRIDAVAMPAETPAY